MAQFAHPNTMLATNKPPLLPIAFSTSQKQLKLATIRIRMVCGTVLAALLGLVMPVRARDARSEPGLSYTNARFPGEPWSIHVVQIDRSRKDLAFFSAHARDKVLGVSLLADQARAVP